MIDKDFLNTFNEYYPFERYIVKEPKRINYLFDDVVLTELFVPSTELKPIIRDGKYVGSTQINDDDIYVKLKTSSGEFRMAYYDFNDHIREEIRSVIIDDFGGWEWECLYISYDDGDDENEDQQCADKVLSDALQTQKKLIKDKYGVCNIKDNFIIEDTINICKKLD